VALCVVAIPAAFWLGNTGVERALLIAVVVLALVVELVNAAVEATVDRISLEHHRLAKRAKDIGSAAVMISLLNAAAVWLLVLL
jgi:diacylglycerol kinase (ATP)